MEGWDIDIYGAFNVCTQAFDIILECTCFVLFKEIELENTVRTQYWLKITSLLKEVKGRIISFLYKLILGKKILYVSENVGLLNDRHFEEELDTPTSSFAWWCNSKW